MIFATNQGGINAAPESSYMTIPFVLTGQSWREMETVGRAYVHSCACPNYADDRDDKRWEHSPKAYLDAVCVVESRL